MYENNPVRMKTAESCLRGIRIHVKVIRKPFVEYCTDQAEILRAHWKLLAINKGRALWPEKGKKGKMTESGPNPHF